MQLLQLNLLANDLRVTWAVKEWLKHCVKPENQIFLFEKYANNFNNPNLNNVSVKIRSYTKFIVFICRPECCFNCVFLLHRYGQRGHWNVGSFPHSYLMWLYREEWCLYCLPHCLQSRKGGNTEIDRYNIIFT